MDAYAFTNHGDQSLSKHATKPALIPIEATHILFGVGYTAGRLSVPAEEPPLERAVAQQTSSCLIRR